MKNEKILLKDIAYEKIKTKIIKGDDTYTSENSLVNELKISRTPIREALQRLEHEGFIQIISNKGIIIPDLSVKDRIELTEMRTAIETYSLKLACKLINQKDFKNLEELIKKQKRANENHKLTDFLEADEEFHEYILNVIGNSMFISAYNNIRERLFTVRESKHIINNQGTISKLIEEHEEIINFLRDKEFRYAVDKLEKHINSGKMNYYIKK